MKHEPRPAIQMEKQLGWACKLAGMEPLGISKVGQTVLARLMEFQIWHQPAGSMALCGEVSEKGQWPLVCLDARHFSLPLHVIGAPQAASAALEPRGSKPE